MLGLAFTGASTGTGTSTGTSTGTTTASAPTITSFIPAEGVAGNTVTITGANFSTTASSNTVKFNGTTGTVSSASATSLTVTVPTGATTGTITVATSDGTATSTSSYTVYTYTVTTFAGTAGSSGTTDGTGTAARFSGPYGISIDSSGNLYVTDSSNYCIRKITSAGVVTTFAGLCGTFGTTDGTGTAARFGNLNGITIDSSGNLYVVQLGNHTIRKITSAGVVTTFAGTAGSSGTTDGTGTAARFYWPKGITIDTSGNLYVADGGNHCIRRITSAGVVTTFAGLCGTSNLTDGTGTAARFSWPRGITADTSGNLYVTDDNQTIRKITSAGVVTTFAGSSLGSGFTDGTGTAARFYWPKGITADTSGNLFVADSGNYRIRKITSAGIVITVAGSNSGSTDGTGTSAGFYWPYGITIDSSGNLYVTDGGNHTIRKIVP